MMEYDDRCFREENEFDLYWGIEEPYWKYRVDQATLYPTASYK